MTSLSGKSEQRGSWPWATIIMHVGNARKQEGRKWIWKTVWPRECYAEAFRTPMMNVNISEPFKQAVEIQLCRENKKSDSVASHPPSLRAASGNLDGYKL